MELYKEMYTGLFNDVTKAINLLESAQARAESIYMEGEDDIRIDALIMERLKRAAGEKDLSDYLNSLLAEALPE